MTDRKNAEALGSCDRRDFVKGSVAAGAAALAASAATSVASAAEGTAAAVELPKGLVASDIEQSCVELDPITEFASEETYDIVVVGAGCAGVPAIMTAVEEGATVGVLQKGDFVLANGRGCSAVVKGHSTPAGVKRYMYDYAELSQYRSNMDLFQYWVDHSEETQSWLLQKLLEAGQEPASYKTSATVVYDNGDIAAVSEFSTRGNQDALTAVAAMAEQQGAVFHYATPAVQLVQDADGTVTGAIGKDAEGNYIKLNATKAVILCAGDYMNNDSLVERYAPGLESFWKKQTNRTGDGHILASLAGSQIVPPNHARQIHGMTGPLMTTPLLILDFGGKRFMNEGTVMTDWSTQIAPHYAGRDDSTIYRFFDSAIEEKYTDLKTTLAAINEAVDGGTSTLYMRADTIEELAELAGLPVDAVVASVERYNELAESGHDEDFGVEPDKMKPIDTPPYYVMPQKPGLAAINGGVYVDAHYQVTTADGQPIPHLFAAGVDAGNICGGIEWNMPGGSSNCHCFTAGRYTVIYALTGGLEPSNPCTFEQVAERFVDGDGTYYWDNGKARNQIEVW